MAKHMKILGKGLIVFGIMAVGIVWLGSVFLLASYEMWLLAALVVILPLAYIVGFFINADEERQEIGRKLGVPGYY